MFETLKCLRDGKNIGGAGWMVGTELKGSIDNTNDLKWTINHISSPQQECQRLQPAQTALKNKRRKCLKCFKMFERASKSFSLLLPLTVSPTQPTTHTETRISRRPGFSLPAFCRWCTLSPDKVAWRRLRSYQGPSTFCIYRLKFFCKEYCKIL